MATANKEMGLSTPLHPHQDFFSPDEMIPKKRKRISLSRKVRKPTMTDESFAEKENVDTTSEPELPVQEQDSQLTHEEPVKKKHCLSLSKKKKKLVPAERFQSVTDKDVRVAARGVVPENTSRNNRWAANNFSEWVTKRSTSEETVPQDLLLSHDASLLCKWLCRFAMETRQENGALYPPKSIYLLLCGLYRICKSNGVPFNFLDKADSRFMELHNTLDTLFSSLHAQGVGAEKKSAAVITEEDEKLMWEKGVLSYDNPVGLQNMVFFYIGLYFSLRGGQEQRDLKIEQFTRHPPSTTIYDASTYYQYVEYIAKNNQHRFKDIHGKTKVVKSYAIPGSKSCLVKILDFYFSKLPPDPKAFYLRPRQKITEGQLWYINVPVGVNTLQAILPRISEQSGTSIRYTNHSLRATSATRLFSHNVPEKVIQEVTGHRSLVGLRSYEHTSMEQERNVTLMLNSMVQAEEKEEKGGIKKEMDKEQDKEEVKKEMDGSTIFTGQLQNCVINLYKQ